ncbi:MAG: Rrf2 family transcriptional regulator [Puniceicoccales bacterium]|jgi:Rrf2 family protein|nr:Rrf2 family transcriptional regulator [Puniceicoccales bacterium]
MKISSKLEYAFRALARIACSYGTKELAHIEELARAEEIPQNYLIQILNELRVGGLLKSKRGKSGGYQLAKAPSEITLAAIATVIDSEMLNGKVALRGMSGPRISEVWGEISGKVKNILDKTTLATLANRDDVREWVI